MIKCLVFSHFERLSSLSCFSSL